MKYIIVNSSTNFEYRVDLIYEYLAAKENEITVLASDFSHSEKKKRKKTKYGYDLIDTIPYKKNLSLRRLLSHYVFFKRAYKKIKDEKADVLYLVIPQNLNAKIGRWYKKRHPDTTVIMDIIDMWPESIPVRYTNLWPFTIWANIRNKNLRYADIIVTECDYYRERLKKWLYGKNTVVIPWLKRYRKWESKYERITEGDTPYRITDRDRLRLCYLGSINNIIDIDKICEVVKNVGKSIPVELNIIGIGEKKEELKRAAQAAGAIVTDHGPIYDDREKQEIMDECDFGVNIMKNTVCVGLSMKSIDYMAAGLPIINNLPGDMERLINERKIGININKDPDAISDMIAKEYNRKNIRNVFEECFSDKNIDKYLNEVMKR